MKEYQKSKIVYGMRVYIFIFVGELNLLYNANIKFDIKKYKLTLLFFVTSSGRQKTT